MPSMVARSGLALRWRMTLLSSLAIVLLSVIAAVTAFVVVRQNLVGDLQRALREDVVRVAQIYAGANVTPPEGPTGGVIVQLYSRQGELLAASNDEFRDRALPTEVVRQIAAPGLPPNDGVRNWHGALGEREVRAALAPVAFGVVVVLSPTDFIQAALLQIGRALAVTTVVLTLLSGVVGYLVAAAALQPVSQLARLAARLEPGYLTPIDYRGPDDEVGQLSTVLNDFVVRLKASIDAQRSFLAETSHELRTPLTSLQGFLERAARRASPEVERDLHDAKRIAQGMSRLVADILQLSRGELVYEYEPHLLEPKEDVLEPVADEFPGVRVAAVDGELLLGDPEKLRQLIRNLTANAVRACGDPACVTVGLNAPATPGDPLELFVRDHGPGIPPDALPRIFDKFYKGKGGGAGLGLAIAKQIVEVHQGRIEVDSTLGEGTTFRIYLPSFDDTNDETDDTVDDTRPDRTSERASVATS
ncbi:MAG: HAMP domain-containing sensor histidine kinase [Trueperaceae bacterium]|nr:HAMP domain-containing sensor histidine kinase [Trueperaceae bacterium]